MSNIHIYPKYGKFGFQILFKANGKREYIKAGTTFGEQFQITINLDAPFNSKNHCSTPTSRYTFNSNQISINGEPLDTMDIADQTIIIRYSKNLWSLFSLQKRIELKQSLLYQFEEDLLKQHNLKSGILPIKCHDFLQHIIEMIESAAFRYRKLAFSVYRFSQAFLDVPQQTILPAKSDSLQLKFKELMKYVISNGFTYPDNKSFKILTGLPKTSFQKQIKAISRKPLTYFIDELKFKRGITEIILADNQMSEIALNLGYSELSPFTRYIKRRTGISPTQIRNKAKGDISNLLLE